MINKRLILMKNSPLDFKSKYVTKKLIIKKFYQNSILDLKIPVLSLKHSIIKWSTLICQIQ